MSAQSLLDRLRQVRQTGHGRWIALCPAHGDKRASLSVRELDDGRVLVHDFGGCAAADVIGAVGLEFADLFPPRDTFDHGKRQRPIRPEFDPLAVLHAVYHEALVVAMLAERHWYQLTVEDHDRLALAVNRIAAALEAVLEDSELQAARRRTA